MFAMGWGLAAGAYTNAAGYTLFHTSLGSITDQLLIRFGIAYKNSSGATLGRATGSLTSAVRQCGSLLGSGVVLVNPGMVTTVDVNYQALTGFLPAAGLDKIMAAFTVTDNDSTYLEYQLVIRTALDPRAPNAWVTTEAAWANPNSANSDRNTGLRSIPAGANITSNMFYQLGVAYRKKSGTGNPRAQIDAAVAGTYA